MDKMKPGRKPSPNPRNIRVTFLVTPAENAALLAAAQQGFEGNVSAMVRRIAFHSIGILDNMHPEPMTVKEN